MYACIGPATAHRGDVMAQQFFQRLIDGLLYRWRVFLHLPARVISAFVRKMKEVSQI